ncbi:MAG: flagellar export protein FliJ [Oscillospiraceae bacterium]|nr:flagellar export protein FliJ [Oscillospiraceae bacterium]
MVSIKRFQFTLDKLKGYKEQVLSKEKGDLAALRAQQAKYAAEQARVQAELDEANEEFLRKSGSGMTIMEMTLFKEYLNSLSDQIRELERKIQLEEEKIKFQTKVVVEANKDVSSLEKLEDKQREEYNFKVAKAEEQFIEEYVSNSVYFKTANQC